MFKNLKIGPKLVALVCLLSLFMVAIGLIGLSGMKAGDAAIDTIYNDRVVPLRDLKVIEAMYADNIVDTTHKARNGALSYDQAIHNIDVATDTIKAKWHDYLSTYLVDDEKALVGLVDIPPVREGGPLLGRLGEYLRQELQAVRGALKRHIEPAGKRDQVREVQPVEVVQVEGFALARRDLLGERVERAQVRKPSGIGKVAVDLLRRRRRGLLGITRGSAASGSPTAARLPRAAAMAAPLALVALPLVAILPLAVAAALALAASVLASVILAGLALAAVR